MLKSRFLNCGTNGFIFLFLKLRSNNTYVYNEENVKQEH